MSENVALTEVRLHSYGYKAIIRKKDDGNWSVGLLISPGNTIFEFIKLSHKEARDFADSELSKYHSCCSLCRNWEIFTGSPLEILEFVHPTG